MDIAGDYVIEFNKYPPMGHLQKIVLSEILLEEVQILLQRDATDLVNQYMIPVRYYAIGMPLYQTRKEISVLILNLRESRVTSHQESFVWCGDIINRSPVVKERGYLVVMDLKDAYFHISISPGL